MREIYNFVKKMINIQENFVDFHCFVHKTSNSSCLNNLFETYKPQNPSNSGYVWRNIPSIIPKLRFLTCLTKYYSSRKAVIRPKFLWKVLENGKNRPLLIPIHANDIFNFYKSFCNDSTC